MSSTRSGSDIAANSCTVIAREAPRSSVITMRSKGCTTTLPPEDFVARRSDDRHDLLDAGGVHVELAEGLLEVTGDRVEMDVGEPLLRHELRVGGAERPPPKLHRAGE